MWEIAAPKPGTEHVTIAVSGARGGHTMVFRRLCGEGVTLVGRTKDFADGIFSFEDDLVANVAGGDANYLSVLDLADAYVARTGLDLPLDPEARKMPPDPESLTYPLAAIDLGAQGVTSIIWATGYRQDFSWLKVDGFDERGAPIHMRGVSAAAE